MSDKAYYQNIVNLVEHTVHDGEYVDTSFIEDVIAYIRLLETGKSVTQIHSSTVRHALTQCDACAESGYADDEEEAPVKSRPVTKSHT